MVVRSLEERDFPHLLKLLKLQDEHPEYRTMAPEGRSIGELEDEFGDDTPYSEIFPFVLEDGHQVVAYLGLCNYEGEAFLEGPVLAPNLTIKATKPLFDKVVEAAKECGYGFIEAFVDERNERAQKALEQAEFEAFRTTYIYEFRRGDKLPLLPKLLPFRFVMADEVDVSAYRDLYRDTSENWATRLAWTDEELIERFDDPGVTLLFAYEGDNLVGHLEFEVIPEEAYAEIAYFGVLPDARGKGLGRALVIRGIEEAFKDDAIELVLARAHDDERSACHALEKIGFKLSHGVVAFTFELG